MSEGKGQRKWPIPEGFTWDHNNDCYRHPDGRIWNPDSNTIGCPVDPKDVAPTTAQEQLSETVEQQINRLGATARRVTPADVQAAISSVYFFRALDGVSGAGVAAMPSDVEALRLTTFCALVLNNGFTVYGKSACASPENYREEVGRRVAREDAERQVWPLLGFELRQMMHARKMAGIEE